jgi:hypothetical protein
MAYHLFYLRHYRALAEALGLALASAPTPAQRSGVLVAVDQVRRMLADDAPTFAPDCWAHDIVGYAQLPPERRLYRASPEP